MSFLLKHSTKSRALEIEKMNSSMITQREL